MRASTKRILSILLSGFFLIGLLVVATALIKPEIDNVWKKRKTLYSKKSLLDNQQKAVDDVQGVIDQFKSFQEARAGINMAIPTSRDTTSIIRQLNAISRTSGVDLNSFDSSSKAFQEAENDLTRRLGTMSVTVSVSGSYQNAKNFVSLLESNVRIFDVTSLNLEPVSEDGSQINLGVEFDTYFQG